MAKFIVFILSTVLTFIIAGVGALPTLLWGFSKENYLATFCILIVLQLFIGKLWNYFIDRRANIETEKIRVADELKKAVQHIGVTCAYCGTANLTNVLIGEDKNTYVCVACKETNSVQIAVSSARTTTPIMPKAELANIFKNIDKK